MLGNVRVLPLNQGHMLPPRNHPYAREEFQALNWLATKCDANIGRSVVPVPNEFQVGIGDPEIGDGYSCTRSKHAEDEIHVCHLAWESTYEPRCFIVWGGE